MPICADFTGTETRAEYEGKLAAVGAYWFGKSAMDMATTRGELRALFAAKGPADKVWESATVESAFRAYLNWWNKPANAVNDPWAPILALDAAARICVGSAADSPEKQKQGIQNGQSERRH